MGGRRSSAGTTPTPVLSRRSIRQTGAWIRRGSGSRSSAPPNRTPGDSCSPTGPDGRPTRRLSPCSWSRAPTRPRIMRMRTPARARLAAAPARAPPPGSCSRSQQPGTRSSASRSHTSSATTTTTPNRFGTRSTSSKPKREPHRSTSSHGQWEPSPAACTHPA